MSYRHLSAGILALASLALSASLGCGSHPIPRVAVAGTTITIPVPSFFGAGFGTVMNDFVWYGSGPPYALPYEAGSIREDEQRGELLFALHNARSGGPATFVTYLPLLRMVRVHIDEGSAAANPAPDDELPEFRGREYRDGQMIALVDIPPEVGAGGDPANYWIFPQRWRRADDHPHWFVVDQPTINDPPINWRGWAGATAAEGIPIRIIPAEDPGTSTFNPQTGWDKIFGDYMSGNVSDDLDVLQPRPKIQLWVTSTDAYPAAWEATINYPRRKVEILGVELGRHSRSGALVGWEPDRPLDDCSVEQSGLTGAFRVFMVDPERQTPWVKVVYRVRPLDETDCEGRVIEGDFAVDPATLKAYDEDGLPFDPETVMFGQPF